MAKEIIAWCDWHLSEEDTRVEGSTVQVAFGSSKPHELDLCDDCYKRLVEPLQSYVADHGQPIKGLSKRSSTDELYRCPAPGCEKVYAHRSSLQKHLSGVHDTSTDTSVDTQPEPLQTVQTQTTAAEDESSAHECPTCEKTFTTPQGLGAHRSRAHSYRAGDDDVA